MYYTTSGAYRKSKMIIDYANIALTVCVGVMFILILFFRSSSGIIICYKIKRLTNVSLFYISFSRIQLQL